MLFADLPSNLDNTRSMHQTVSKKSLRRRRSVKPRNGFDQVDNDALEEGESFEEILMDNDGKMDVARSLPAPMRERKSVRYDKHVFICLTKSPETCVF